MMRTIVASSLKFRRLVVAVAAGLLVLGITQLRHLPVDELPEFGPTMVEVRAESLGLSAEEVEQLITVPLEQDLLNGIPFLQDIYSESVPGMSSVVMIFEPGTPLLDARQVVAEKLAEAAVALPGVSSTPPHMLQPLSTTSRVLTARLYSDELSAIDMSVLARWVVGPRLLGVPGVANVSFWGQRDRQLQVLVDPERLHDAGVSLDQIVRTTGNSLWVSPLTFLEASTPGTAGFIDGPNQRFGIRHVLPIRTPEDLAQIPIEDADGNAVIVNGEPLRLADVAEVVEDHQPLIGDALFREGPGLLLVVEKNPDASTVEVTHDVEEALQGMLPGLSGLQIDTSLFRPASYIETATDNLARILAIGIGLLILALAILLSDWRRALVAATVAVTSIVVAGLVLYLREAPANLMVLAGLVMAIGIVVDDAVVDLDRFTRALQRREEGDGAPAWRSILDASIEMRGPALTAGFIAVAAVVPVFFLDGQAGSFLPPLVVSYVLAIAASMLAALTLTPALGMILLANASERREPPVIGSIRRGWERGLALFIHRASWGYAAVGVLVLIALVSWPFLERSSSVHLKETDLLIDLEAAPGTSLPAMNEVTSEAVAEIGALPGVRNVSAHVGRAINADQVVNVNSGQIWVSLEPDADREAAITSLDEVMSGFEGLSHDVLTYSEERISDVLLTTDEDIVVRLYGADLQVLHGKAEEIRTLLAGIDGIEDPTVETVPTEPNIEVEVDLERAQQVGVKPGDVRRTSAILVSGLAVGNLFEDQKVFDVVVWGTPEIRTSVEDVQSLLIETATGDLVRLDQVADVRVAPNPVVKRHESVSNYLDVSATVAGRDPGAVVADVEAAVATVEFPLEHHAVVRGAVVSGDDSNAQVLATVAAAAIGIFLLLQAAFTSWRLAILAFVALPLALVGGLLGAVIAGGTLTLGSFAGLLALTGLAARHAILLIKGYQRAERKGTPFGEELVMDGARERVAPVLISTIATTLALVPVVVAGDIAGLEILRPMAVVTVGGLLGSALVTLLILPAMYLRHGYVAKRDTVAEDLVIVVPEAEPEVVPASGS